MGILLPLIDLLIAWGFFKIINGKFETLSVGLETFDPVNQM